MRKATTIEEMKRLEPTLSGGTGTYASRMNSIEQQLTASSFLE
jgi:hypothetical protein